MPSSALITATLILVLATSMALALPVHHIMALALITPLTCQSLVAKGFVQSAAVVKATGPYMA